MELVHEDPNAEIKCYRVVGNGEVQGCRRTLKTCPPMRITTYVYDDIDESKLNYLAVQLCKVLRSL